MDQKKLEKIKGITPRADFASFSKLLILDPNKADAISKPEENLRAGLKAFQNINPSREYALSSRLALMEAIETRKFTSEVFFKRLFNYGASMGVAVAVLVLLISAAAIFSPELPIIGQSDRDTLLTEAGDLSRNIDIHLEEINYYALTTQRATVALNEAFSSKAVQASDEILNKEADQAEYKYSGRNKKIDSLLEQASL